MASALASTGSGGRELSPALSARQEWANMWPIPLVAMLGACGSTMFAYSTGTFMGPMTAQFGWTRTAFSAALVLQLVFSFFILPMLGWVTDRIGPRRVALAGIIPYAIAMSLLGLAGGSIWQWWLMCLLVAVTQAPITQIVWVTGVVGRFESSRGLAMAVTLAGLAAGTLVWPLLTAYYIHTFGWRVAYSALAISWAVIVFPLTAAFFFGSPRGTPAIRRRAPAGSYQQALKSRAFVFLMIAGGLYASAYFGVLVHFVPILQSKGLGAAAAAGVAGLVGVFGVTGRLIAGYLLDRFPTRPVALVAFLLPALAAMLLLFAQGSAILSLLAVICFGLSSGAETDVITFVAARRFGKDVFASVYGIFSAIIAACSSTGPILAGAVFDHYKSYDHYLMVIPFMVVVGALLFVWIPLEPVAGKAEILA